MGQKPQVPVVEGWFTLDDAPHLIGAKCTKCGTYFFPKTVTMCSNPTCDSIEFEEVPLSRTGRIWSYTENCYAPPEPYVSPEPFVPYTVAAVELDREKMVVLGQVSAETSVDSLEVGTEVELAIGTLYEDDESEYLMWNWRPVAS
jgi:uncharacterized OB-fold protein